MRASATLIGFGRKAYVAHLAGERPLRRHEKALVWQDEADKAWLCYNDMRLAREAAPEVDPTLSAIAAVLGAIAGEAIGSR